MPHETGTSWWDNLQTIVTDWFKEIQTTVDALAPDPTEDNSMLPLASLPYKFDTTMYNTVYTYNILDGYGTSSKNYGMQPWLMCYRLNLYNNRLQILNCAFLGKAGTGSIWNSLTQNDIDQITAAGNNLYTGTGKIEVINDYPTNNIIMQCNNNGELMFIPSFHDNTNIRYRIPRVDGAVVVSKSTCKFQYINKPYYDTSAACWKPNNLNDVLFIQGELISTSYGATTIAVFDNQYDAQYLVNRLSQASAHNGTIAYTKTGSSYTLYYGDHYLIYQLNSSNVYNYTDLFTGTKQATDAINANNPTATPIVTPTYENVKYDETDANHTKPMELTKFVPDTNGMVYYYELDKDDVWKVRSGLNEINIDPLVLKDVTRNLVSYKIFAFSPTALIKTKTPVIVHIGGREIKYNDASIPANYVEELNTIPLGAITINKLFGDYRDYAPYTKIELFVPFCGWTTLPSWCIDTTITGEMFVDMWNGSCKAVIKASATDAPDGVVVCEMGGVCAYDVPFVADATGAKAASLLSKVATTAGAVATGNPLAIATSGISLATALNENYTRMMGVVGDGSNINGLDHMFVKLTRVSWTDAHKKARPDAYKHMHGIPCGKQLKLSSGDGFTQITDATITGAMTDREKQMIIDGFRHGLIL